MSATAPSRTRCSPGGAVAAALAAALLLPSHGLAAQEGVDARWLPWLGCWSEVGTPGELLCVRPAPEADGVELVTVRGGQIAAARRLRADGVAREAALEGCEGTQRAEFSPDGRRLYLRSDLVCEGELDRDGTGLVAMVSPSEWIRVETVEVAGETAAVTERYRPAGEAPPAGTGLADITAGREMAVDAARRAASAAPTMEALLEASRRLDAEAVKTWVAERGQPLDVDAGKLVRLADAGVPEEVIDVVVAVSFPEEFRVDRDARGEAGRRFPSYGYRSPFPTYGWNRRGAFYDPFMYGYAGYGSYGWWYGARRPAIVVVRSDDGGGGGRVIHGRGYTQGISGSAAEPSPSSAPAALPRTGPSGRSPGSVTPSGARSGGSTGRKAKPKDDGSGGDGGD